MKVVPAGREKPGARYRCRRLHTTLRLRAPQPRARRIRQTHRWRAEAAQPPGADAAAGAAPGALAAGAPEGAPAAARWRFATLIAASAWLATATRMSASGCRYFCATRWMSAALTAVISFG